MRGRLLVAAMLVAWSSVVRGQAPAAIQGQQTQTGDAAEPATTDVVVVTASRREEQLLNAPVTMTVITEEVIGNAPSQSVTDLLRAVPGINTAQTSARDVNVASRAATGTLADSLLVLLDGRSIYQDFFGFVMWDFLPIDQFEIKQIEVIRGPASAVWGANALTGVVNVITKTPREMLGTTVSLRFGQVDRTPHGGTFDAGSLFSVHATHAAALDDRFAFKVSAGYLTQEPFLRPSGNLPGTSTPYPPFTNKGTHQPRLDGRIDYDFADTRQKLVIAAGLAGTQGIMHTGLGPLDIQDGASLKYGRITYTRDKLKLQMFVNDVDGQGPFLLQMGTDGSPLTGTFANQAYDVEFSNLNLLRTRHLLSYGGNFRHNNFALSLAPRGTTRNESGAYVQDEIFLSEHFRWMVGARVDWFDVLHKPVVSPRTAFLVKPAANQTVRLSFNRAFRAPSFINSYFDTTFLAQVDLGAAGVFQAPVSAVGNLDLREERLRAYEIGYSALLGRFRLDAAFFFNRTRDTVLFTQTESYTSANPPPQWPLPPAVLDLLAATGRGVPSEFSYRNFEHVTEIGGEVSAGAQLTPTVNAFANYSWQDEPQPQGFSLSELNLPPTHRVNAGLSFNGRRYFGSLSASVQDGAFWQDVIRFDGPTDPFTLVDGGVGLRSADGTMTVAARASNLLNSTTQQHVFGDVIKRTLIGEVRFAF